MLHIKLSYYSNIDMWKTTNPPSTGLQANTPQLSVAIIAVTLSQSKIA